MWFNIRYTGAKMWNEIDDTIKEMNKFNFKK
jgi:hypothetical protein